ncbi:hypothetical protein A6B43_07760 [Vespertiliibacter pulmonis]|uniref:Z-ring associated protein G n=1 Tax=Vespertiliibacter pulmonis TaxID=1443036 RepID=A0A3N4VX66_9PAST|nr:YhcB family protein [Vespertiliibacter pulmonis]QLB21421.1 hypothetical protein A6B43_07760 [Vespertiliibacter pulmonis]RPE85835.1 hypothetical protein EDC46_0220 [Vespertiliibacter pulmonis]
MEHWSNEMWVIIICAFILGIIIGYVVLRTTNANAKKQQQLASELKSANLKIEQQKEQLEKHFQQSANLLATLADDYKKLYTHLAESSQSLLPEEAQQKIEFFQPTQITNTAVTEDNQPKDYSEGSSGILKS